MFFEVTFKPSRLFLKTNLKIRSLGTTPISGKLSRSERAILGALGEFRGILGAALGIGNSILGMASHDLINTKPTILGATLGAIPGIVANPPERFSFAPAFSERFFKNWGGPRAPDKRYLPQTLQALFAMLQEGRPLLVRGTGPRAQGVKGERPSKCHLGPDPHPGLPDPMDPKPSFPKLLSSCPCQSAEMCRRIFVV